MRQIVAENLASFINENDRLYSAVAVASKTGFIWCVVCTKRDSGKDDSGHKRAYTRLVDYIANVVADRRDTVLAHKLLLNRDKFPDDECHNP